MFLISFVPDHLSANNEIQPTITLRINLEEKAYKRKDLLSTEESHIVHFSHFGSEKSEAKRV